VKEVSWDVHCPQKILWMVLLSNLVASVSSNETMEEDGTREEEDNVAMHSSKVVRPLT
jgi:hypothetical protein